MNKDELIEQLQNCHDGAIHQMGLTTYVENMAYWRGKRDGLDVAMAIAKGSVVYYTGL